MSKLRAALLGLTLVSAAAMAMPAGASAAAIYKYDISNIGPDAQAYVSGLDASKRTTIRLMRLGVQQYRTNQAAGPSSDWFGEPIQSGDVIEVYQHAAGDPVLPDPPGVPATETFTVPQLGANVIAGNPLITGVADDGWDIYTQLSHPCGPGPREKLLGVRSPGAFSATFPFPPLEGSSYALRATNSTGDKVTLNGRVAGDGRCFEVDAYFGTSTSTYPFEVAVGAIDNAAIPTTRVVLRRSGAAIGDENSDDVNLTVDKRPLPGDVVEVYRPHTAAAPAYTYTLPAFSAVVDANNNMLAVDVEAGSIVGAWVCRRPDCSPDSSRASRVFAAGRTIFNYGESQGDERPFDILPTDVAGAWWVSTDERATIEIDVNPGDLTPPIGKIKLTSRLDTRKLSKRLKYKLNSNEAGSVSSVLSTPKLPKRGSTSAKKPVTLATGTGNVIAGNNTLSLKPTRSGKKAIKRIAAARKTVKATLTVTLRDAASNATTVIKNVKVKVKR